MPYIRMKVSVTGTASDARDEWVVNGLTHFYYDVDAFGTDDQRHKDAVFRFYSEVHLKVPSDFDLTVTSAPYSDPDEDEPHGSKTAAETLGGSYGDLSEEEEPEEPVPNFWYLNVYLTDRAYGGPEEGGWYYDCGVPATDLPDVAVCYGPYSNSEEDQFKLNVQREHVQLLLDQHNRERRSDLNSVLSEGRYVVDKEGHIAKHWPETRPYYE